MSSSSDNDSEIEQNDRSARGQNIDFDSNDMQTIISDFIQYVITNSQKKIPIKKASE